MPAFVSDQPVEAVDLQTKQIWHFEWFVNLREGNALGRVSGPCVFVGDGQWDPSTVVVSPSAAVHAHRYMKAK